MDIDRRTFLFLSGVVLVAGPMLAELPGAASVWRSSSPEGPVRLAVRIEGWCAPDDGVAVPEVWIALGRSCRTAWR